MLIESATWFSDALERLAKLPCGYHFAEPNAAEPIALAAVALAGANRVAEAQMHLEWLAKLQLKDGCVPPYSTLQWPGWPTPLAMIAAAVASRQTESSTSEKQSAVSFSIEQAKQWLLAAEGKTLEKSPDFGHDGMLVGWPWVIGTHSWQEPTAWAVLALKAIGLNDHPRTREGVRMLVDRLLPTGGCNYGNTYVLGQRLRAQVEPTGLAMLALVGERQDDLRIPYSLQYLIASLSAETTPISLSYGLLGLTAHGRRPDDTDTWLAAAYKQTVEREASPLKLSLLVLAAQGADCPLVKTTKVAVDANAG